jgi:hypothetical protein
MKALQIFTAVLILALLLSGATMTLLHPIQAAEPQGGAIDVIPAVEPRMSLSDTESTELPVSDPAPLDHAQGGQDRPFSVLSGPSVDLVVQSLASNWHVECVDCPKQFSYMTDRSLRLDGDGRPHIAYGGKHLYYAWQDGTTWHIETVDSGRLVGRFASLVLDGSGQPHVSYLDSGKSDLKYAWRDGTTWHAETVDSGGGMYTSLALDSASRPHISYDGSDGVKYAWYDGTTWHIETVDSGGGCTSLALDGFGRPHISYTDWSNHDLKYAWHDGLAWHIETIDSGGGCTSLVLDASGRPHISYIGYANGDSTAQVVGKSKIDTLQIAEMGHLSPQKAIRWSPIAGLSVRKRKVSRCLELYRSGDLKYAWHDGLVWHIETVDSEGDVGHYNSLALDGSGRPHISYYDKDNGDLKYAWHDGLVWHVETIDSEGDVGEYTSLALDGAGRPHISYHHCRSRPSTPSSCITGDLDHAWFDGVTWWIETIDSARLSGLYTSLVLGEAGQRHISYCSFFRECDTHGCQLKCDELRYARYDGESWQVETIDSERGVGTYTSLALDGTGRPHISYSGDGVKYAWYDGTAWYTETVDTIGQYTSLALDGADRPHISYYGGSQMYTYDLKYAWHDGTDWHVETVDSEGVVGEYTSLALDGVGRPHISYHDGTNHNLKYTWHDGTTWHIETVDSEGWVGKYTSLALDRSGQPHIIYHGSGGLKYAWHDSGEWHVETVDNEIYVGYAPSLALDGASRPHVSYCELGEMIPFVSSHCIGLKYAWHDGTTWRIETVENGWNVGGHTSLALDRSGRPHISYYAGNTDDLKYALLVHSLPFLNKQPTPSDCPRYADILTYTLTLFGPDLNVRLWDPLPSFLHYIPGSITSTTTPMAVYSPTVRAIVWQGRLPTATVQTIDFQVRTDVAGAELWPAPVTNTAWLTDTDNHRSISATTTINVLPPPLYLGKRATPSDGMRNNGCLTYTLTISGAGLNVRLWDPLPALVRYVPGTITGTVTPTAVYSPAVHAVIWQGRLLTGTMEVVHFQVTPGITGTGSLDLVRPIVNTAWLTDTDSGWGVSATAIVNGRHIYLPLVVK